MRQYIGVFIFLCLGFINSIAQQAGSLEDDDLVTPIEIRPKWILGSNEQLIKEIIAKIDYPYEQCVEGVTVLQFTVDTNGQVSNAKIKRSISNKVDEQLLKLIYKYDFMPGRLFDRKVNCNLYLPIKITLK